MRSMMGSFFGPYGMMNSYAGYGMMGYGYSGGYGDRYGLTNGLDFELFGLLGLIFGVIVIVSAIMLNRRPQEHSTWGVLIVLFSVLSIFGGAMNGFAGLILGLVGGVLAITWKPTRSMAKAQ